MTFSSPEAVQRTSLVSVHVLVITVASCGSVSRLLSRSSTSISFVKVCSVECGERRVKCCSTNLNESISVMVSGERLLESQPCVVCPPWWRRAQRWRGCGDKRACAFCVHYFLVVKRVLFVLCFVYW